MDQSHNVPYFPFLLTILFTTLTLVLRRILKKSRPNSPKLPPGPPKLPIIGNLHLMIGKVPHHYFRDLSKTYGPIMLLQLGEVPTFIFSSPETAKDVLKTHDLVFVSRPRLPSFKFLSYDYTDVAFAPYGDYLRQVKKICTTKLLSQARVNSFRSIRAEEVSKLVKDVTANEGSIINFKETIYSVGVSIISRATFGGKSRYQEEFSKLVPDILELFGGLSLVDLFPSFSLLHVIHGMMPKPKKLHKQADEILEKIVMEHRAKKAANNGWSGTDADDLLYVLLDLQDCGDLEVPLTTDNIKAILMDMFSAGIETTAVTIQWAMSEMLKNPRVMKKAQAEVRHVFAAASRKGNVVNEEMLGELKYLNMVIKETLRLHPAGPLMAPRESRERCEINGYEIPAKSRVLVNVWAIGRDPNYWTEAEKFFPERFLDSNIDYRGNDFEFIPFGSGRRMCAGIAFSSAIVELQLASLLYHFDWKLPDGQNPENLDMTEVFKGVGKRKHDLCLIPIPYRPMH